MADRPPLDGVTLITGASSGIGAALARLLAARARALVLVARRAERLCALRDELLSRHPALVVDVRPCDLANDEATMDMLEQSQAVVGPIDNLVNNAGFGDVTLFERARWEKLEQMIALNVTVPTRLIARLLPGMLARRRGGILNISSGWGLTFFPAMATYAGTKHYITAFSECLRLELRGTGVAVTQVCPGPVATEFLDVAGNAFGRPPPALMVIDADHCARAALRGFARGRALVVPGFFARLLIWAGRLTPRALLRLVYAPIGRLLRRR